MSGADRVIKWSTALAVLGVAAVAAVASYEHAYDLVRAHGESGWTARMVPLTVDGLIYASSMVMLDSARRQTPVPACELTALKEIGVRVAIDDFGTGHSSLARLKQLPIDLIKIDRVFVDGLTPGGPAQMITGILQIAASLDVDAVAEGIEQTSERDLLAKLGCRFG